jgi:hypothetical protein
MMEILLHIHSILRWIILLLCIVVLVKSYQGFSGKKLFRADDNKFSLWLMISCHVMLLIGLLQYFIGANGFQLFQTNPVSIVMKTKALRFFAIEHTLVNIIGIVFITLGRILSKKAISDFTKHKKLFIYTLIGLLLILSRIPWPGMADIGRGWY